MHPLHNGSQVTVRPDRKKTEGIAGYFSESNDNGAPSYPGQDWFNNVIDEFMNVIAASDVEFDPTKVNNLALAFSSFGKTAGLAPVGLPQLWLSDTLPDAKYGEYAFMKGQAFDKETYPELATIYPSGFIPTMAKLGIMGKGDGEVVGDVEEGQVKAHGHTGTASSTDLGTKYTNTTGHHSHHFTVHTEAGSSYNSHPCVGDEGSRGTVTTSSNGNHSHSVGIGSHGHSITINPTGAAKNTIDHRKFNFIVRMA